MKLKMAFYSARNADHIEYFQQANKYALAMNQRQSLQNV
jgi:hypothetical protein